MLFECGRLSEWCFPLSLWVLFVICQSYLCLLQRKHRVLWTHLLETLGLSSLGGRGLPSGIQLIKSVSRQYLEEDPLCVLFPSHLLLSLRTEVAQSRMAVEKAVTLGPSII